VKSKWTRLLLGALLVGLLVAGPMAYARHRQSLYRNFRVVEEGKLYRSGQMSVEALQRTIKEYQIKTVISLRYANSPDGLPPDWREEEFCRNNGIQYVRIRPRSWHIDSSGEVPAEVPVSKFLKTMDDPNIYPALIHCFAGKHRTGAYCSLYRMEYQHWTNDEATKELMQLGYTTFEDEKDIQGYLESYIPRWKRARGETRGPLVEPVIAGRMEN
jgi:protein tyrosine/serine phosphatase